MLERDRQYIYLLLWDRERDTQTNNLFSVQQEKVILGWQKI